jgi:hypothetical protein
MEGSWIALQSSRESAASNCIRTQASETVPYSRSCSSATPRVSLTSPSVGCSGPAAPSGSPHPVRHVTRRWWRRCCNGSGDGAHGKPRSALLIRAGSDDVDRAARRPRPRTLAGQSRSSALTLGGRLRRLAASARNPVAAGLRACPRQVQEFVGSRYLLTWTKTMLGADLDVRLCRSQHDFTLPSIVSKLLRVPDSNIPMWLSPVRKFDPSQS